MSEPGIVLIPYSEFLSSSINELKSFIKVSEMALKELTLLSLRTDLSYEYKIKILVIKENLDRANMVLDVKLTGPFEISVEQLN